MPTMTETSDNRRRDASYRHRLFRRRGCLGVGTLSQTLSQHLHRITKAHKESAVSLK